MNLLLAEHLHWDSDHFGFPVWRLAGDLSDDALHDALARIRASHDGDCLVYWSAEHGRHIPPDIIAQFHGRLVDRKVTYTATLKPADGPLLPDGFRISEYPKGPPGQRMIDLACAAGWTSRFFVDPRFPLDKFHFLFETWMTRSTLREIADAVFVVHGPTESEPVGMITLAIQERTGNIGLIAVLDRFRGRGLASALLGQAHAWMVTRGASQSTVVTQKDNSPACSLYQRFGYSVDSVRDVYHFWPTANLSLRPADRIRADAGGTFPQPKSPAPDQNA